MRKEHKAMCGMSPISPPPSDTSSQSLAPKGGQGPSMSPWHLQSLGHRELSVSKDRWLGLVVCVTLPSSLGACPLSCLLFSDTLEFPRVLLISTITNLTLQ